jgi:hypothetical protein
MREVHCNSYEGAHAALRSYLRPVRGVHQKHLGYYVTTYEMIAKAKRLTAAILQRMCFVTPPMHPGFT